MKRQKFTSSSLPIASACRKAIWRETHIEPILTQVCRGIDVSESDVITCANFQILTGYDLTGGGWNVRFFSVDFCIDLVCAACDYTGDSVSSNITMTVYENFML